MIVVLLGVSLLAIQFLDSHNALTSPQRTLAYHKQKPPSHLPGSNVSEKGRKKPLQLTEIVRLEHCQGRNKLAQSWCLDSTGTARYTDQTTNITDEAIEKVYWTRHGVEQCLADLSIVMIGDSRVRYQYMALVAFLRTAVG